MFVDILIFTALGICIGVLFGLVPGLHPNLIVLFVPFFIALDINQLPLLALIAAMAVSNSMIDFIPSILLGVPDSGNELAVLPGHRMLLRGKGYEAIKLTVIGGFGSVLICLALFPLLAFFIPFIYTFAQPFIYLLLMIVASFMIFTEKTAPKRIMALFYFFLAGAIGIMGSRLPIDNNLVLFPVLSGLFGISFLLLQIRNKVGLPEQEGGGLLVSGSVIKRGVIFGSLGGVFSGLLPGVGSSEIATIATVDKNDHSFLVTIGAITTANILISILSLWLIGKGRSGVAVVVSQLIDIGFEEILIVLFTGLLACGISALLTLFIAKRFIGMVKKLNYGTISLFVIVLVIILVFLFSGIYGLFLTFVCTCLGVSANLIGIKRGNLMGVLIMPTILFYLGI